MVQFLGTVRAAPSIACFAPCRRRIPIGATPFSLPRNGFPPFKRILLACLQSNTAGNASTQVVADQSEIVFMGTGTSEEIPQLSCLANPLKNCSVCSQAAEQGNKNKNKILNTSILIRLPGDAGMRNILTDAGKFFYHSALQWFPAFGDVSDIPEETYPLLENCEILIMDALRPDRSSATHFGLPRALDEVRKIQPRRTLFTGERIPQETEGIGRPRRPAQLRRAAYTGKL